jgi:PAS domain S-box-containing protein
MMSRISFFGKLWLGAVALVGAILALGAAIAYLHVAGQARAAGLPAGAYLWLAGATAALAALLAGLLTWFWYVPLMQLTLAARRIASGELTGNVHIRGAEELTHLGRALNRMRSSLAEKLRTIASQRENLQTVISNLREGVLALDGHGRIILMNDFAATMLSADEADATGRQLQSVVRVPEVVDGFNEIIETGQTRSRQFEIDLDGSGRTFDLNAVRVAAPSEEGICVLLVVRDITESVRMAAMKAEFVANASHELRTPLATIRAAIDSLATLDDGDRPAMRKLLSILDRHTGRLEGMTNDLLDLHMIEKARQRLQLQPVPLGDLADWAREFFGDRAAERHVEFQVSADPPEALLTTDQTLLELILQNLIDNAVKFTPAGGTVRFELEADGEGAIARVSDTGPGISPELQDRVFERFFQAEPSRSGDTQVRGTGLGLAIVKHASERLGADLELRSRVGRGSTFEVRLPSAGK